MDVRVFRQDKDVLSKNPAGGTDPDRVAGGARRPGCAFFWLLFFNCFGLYMRFSGFGYTLSPPPLP